MYLLSALLAVSELNNKTTQHEAVLCWHHCAVTESFCCMLAACAKNVLTFTLRSPANWMHSMPSRHSTPHTSVSDGAQGTPASTSVASSDSRYNSSNNHAEEACQYPSINPAAVDPPLGVLAGVGPTDISSQDSTRTVMTAEGLDLDLDDALHDAQQLIQAAEQVVKESCREKWLLQPFIPDMERNEYRSA